VDLLVAGGSGIRILRGYVPSPGERRRERAVRAITTALLLLDDRIPRLFNVTALITAGAKSPSI